jgi:hypothetical protein
VSNSEKAKISENLHLFNAWHKPCLLTLLKGLLEANGNVGLISDSRPSWQATAFMQIISSRRNQGDAFDHSLNDIMTHRGAMIATFLS